MTMTTRLQPRRPFGATGVTVPLIGYGTAPLGKEHITREHAVRCLNHAIDQGIIYLDTSPDYGSEPHGVRSCAPGAPKFFWPPKSTGAAWKAYLMNCARQRAGC